MKLHEIERLVELLENSEVSEIEIKSLFSRVWISKNSGCDCGPAMSAPPVAPVPAQVAEPVSAGIAPKPETEAEEDLSHLYELKSPIVGTFYGAPSPGADDFVKVGDKVSEGQTLCIVEAMKIMNEIEADVSGTVREISVKNGEPVEYNQTLFSIEP